MKTRHYLIHEPSKGFLDGYDGAVYEWTPNRKTAWGFVDKQAASYKLEWVKKQFPNAVIVTR